MLKLNKKSEYALIAMLYIAQKDSGSLTTARELAEIFHIPSEMIGKVLQKLAKQGLIASLQGVKGGYALRRPLEQISISEVVCAVEGPLCLVNCSNRQEKLTGTETPPCHIKFCNIKAAMGVIQYKLRIFFNSISLKDLQNEQLIKM